MAFIKLYEPINRKSFWQSLFGECIGTMLLVALGCGIIYINFSHGIDNSLPHSTRIIYTGAGFGIVVGALVWAFEYAFPYGTCHINPAVTLAILVLGNVTLVRAVLNICFQVVGATIGAAFLYYTVPTMREICFPCTVPNGVEPIEAFVMEMGMTYCLAFGALATFKVAEKKKYGPGVVVTAITTLIAILVIVAAPYTGAGLNPARSFGPALIFGGKCWPHHWVYWAGPICGGVLAGACLRILFHEGNPPKSKKEVEANTGTVQESEKLV